MQVFWLKSIFMFSLKHLSEHSFLDPGIKLIVVRSFTHIFRLLLTSLNCIVVRIVLLILKDDKSAYIKSLHSSNIYLTSVRAEV